MKDKLFIVFLIFVSFSLKSQITRDWIAQYNGTANMYDQPVKILTDDLNNIYIAGFSGEISSTSGDFLLMKYSGNGDVIWKQNYNGPASSFDGINDFILDASGNIYVTGISRSGVSQGTEDYCTIKYDSSGNLQWLSRYDDVRNEKDVPVRIIADNMNNIYVCGYSSQPYNPAQSTFDIVIIKYSNNGDSIWRSVYNNNGAYTTEDLSSIDIDANNNLYITGKGYSGFESYNILTIKYNSSGNMLWAKQFDGLAHRDDYGEVIKCDLYGNAYVLGSTITELNENFDFVLIKYSPIGDTLWVRKYNGVEDDRDFGRSMIIDNDFIYVTGVCEDSSTQNSDIVTVKYDIHGNLIWSATFDGAAHMADTPAEIKKDPFGYYFVVGSSARGVMNWDFVIIRYDSLGNQLWFDTYNSQSNFDDNGVDLAFGVLNDMYFTGYSEISGQLNDVMTIKYDNVTGMEFIGNSLPVLFSLSQNFPNPFNPMTKLKFQMPKSGIAVLKVFDVLGKEIQVLVNQELSPGTYEVDFDGSNLASGVYYYTLSIKDFIETKRMVLVK